MKNEDIPENKGIFIHGFEHNNADKGDNYFLIGCESDEFYKKRLNCFNFWSNKFINMEIEKRKFK